MNLESSTLVLRTAFINANNGDINVGNLNSDVTWKVNLQSCIGKSLYEKYDRFKICLTSVGSGAPAIALSEINRTVSINIEGFNWFNQSYNSQTGSINSNVIACSVLLGTTVGSTTNFTGETGFVFNKPLSSDVNIRIYLSKVVDGLISNVQYPNSVYCFSIYGIE